jgi:hypothetical protein
MLFIVCLTWNVRQFHKVNEPRQLFVEKKKNVARIEFTAGMHTQNAWVKFALHEDKYLEVRTYWKHER